MKKILRAILLLFIVVLTVKIYFGFKETSNALSEHLPAENFLSQADSDLMPSKFKTNFELVEKYPNKVRNPVLLFLYNTKYYVLIYEIDSLRLNSLTNDLKYKNTSVSRSTDIAYSSIGKSIAYSFQYAGGQDSISNKLYLTIAGDSIRQIANTDSVAGYNFILKDLSLKYDREGPIDIFIENEGNFMTKKHAPMIVGFVRRMQKVILYVITPKEGQKMLPDNLLLEIMK